MKKIKGALLGLGLVLALSSCGGDENTNTSLDESSNTIEPSVDPTPTPTETPSIGTV